MDANALDVYRMSPDKSILNNTLRSKILRRPVYATSTKDSITQVWRIEAHGALVRIAVVNWSARSVTVGEIEQRLEQAMVKPKGFFHAGSRVASIGSTQFKLQAVVGEQWHEAWRCTISKPRARTGKRKSNEEKASYSARFVPPQPCLKASELHLYGAASAATRSDLGNGSQPIPRETIDNLIVCCILVAAGRDEYKILQNSSRPSARGVRTQNAASPKQPNAKSSLTGRQLPMRSFCIEGIHVPPSLMEIQRRLYALNVAAGSAITLPPYQKQKVGGPPHMLSCGAIDIITTNSPPPAYS